MVIAENGYVLVSLLRRRERRRAVRNAFGRIVERARDPFLYAELGVPDTLDGRFELLALHAFLVLSRLRRDHAETAGFSQALFDAMFADLDRGLREMGVADLGVGRRVQAMARGFYGRIAAYERGLVDADALVPALRRNLYGTVHPTPTQLVAAAAYIRDQVTALVGQSAASLMAGDIHFAPLEAT